MKKCPACGKEFEDSMRFCQVDGTALLDVEPPLDPYATMVGHKLDLMQEEPSDKPAEEIVIEAAAVEIIPTLDEVTAEPLAEVPAKEIASEPLIHETTGSIPIAVPDEVLELSGVDPLKTMYVSESEMKEVFGAQEQANETPVEPAVETAAPSFDATPPSPFSVPEEPAAAKPPFEHAETETVLASEASSPFREPEPAPVWTTPPAPDAAWQGQQNVQYQPAPPNAGGPSQGLAIGSLVCGILSCTICCSMGIFFGPAALLMGFMAKKKAEESPLEYGGRGLALGGMISGAVGVLFGLGIILYYIIVGVAVFSGGLPN